MTLVNKKSLSGDVYQQLNFLNCLNIKFEWFVYKNIDEQFLLLSCKPYEPFQNGGLNIGRPEFPF